jgi:hypothetical protein
VPENKGSERGVKMAKQKSRRSRKYATPRGLARPFEAALEAQGRQDGLESRVHVLCYRIFIILLIICKVLVMEE